MDWSTLLQLKHWYKSNFSKRQINWPSCSNWSLSFTHKELKPSAAETTQISWYHLQVSKRMDLLQKCLNEVFSLQPWSRRTVCSISNMAYQASLSASIHSKTLKDVNMLVNSLIRWERKSPLRTRLSRTTTRMQQLACFCRISPLKVNRYELVEFLWRSVFSVGQNSFDALKRLETEIDPKHFWVSMRCNNETETVSFFKDELNFTIFDF